MVQTIDAKTATQPAPLRISRIFPAPPELVFKAWSSTDHVRRWFHPTGYSAPEGRVQMHVGGPFEVCMRAPDGTRHWTRGTFVEVVPDSRLVLDLYATDAEGRRLFRCHTEVSFTDEGAVGTRMEVVQTYTFEDSEAAAPMVEGAPIGWSQTLDKLGAAASESSNV